MAIEWLTIDEIKAAAKESDIAALRCSVKHWEQVYEASFEEYEKALDAGLVGHDEEYCALCMRMKCSQCAANKLCGPFAFGDYLWATAKRWILANVPERKPAIKAMLDGLRALLPKEAPDEKP